MIMMDQKIFSDRNSKSGNKQPTVCAIVLNWNAYDDTTECIESLKKIEYDNIKIIIVDNASTDGSGEKLSKTYLDISFLKLNHNGGYAAGNNAGILWGLQNGFDYFLVINNDTIVEPHFLTPLIETIEANPSIGIVTGKVLYYDQQKRIYSAGGYFSKLLCTGMNGKFKENDEALVYEEMIQEISFVPGCMMLIRRIVFEDFGLFDEKYFLYFEDFEFSRRISTKYKLGYVPSSQIYHKSGGGTHWSNYTPTYLYYHSRNRIWVFRNGSIAYQTYVLLYSFLNAFAKTIMIMYLNYKETKIFPWKQIKAIRQGIIDGLIK
jgi:GT2 family glycosyltransferase